MPFNRAEEAKRESDSNNGVQSPAVAMAIKEQEDQARRRECAAPGRGGAERGTDLLTILMAPVLFTLSFGGCIRGPQPSWCPWTVLL